jgi:hypothetical protein
VLARVGAVGVLARSFIQPKPFFSIFFMQLKIVYKGENGGQEIPSMCAPRIADFHDPSHFDTEVEIFKDQH